MKVALLVGSHLRHLHFASAILESGFLSGLVIEHREQMIPEPPAALELDRSNFVRHFEERDEVEKRVFGNVSDLESVPLMRIAREELNSRQVRDFVISLKPQLLISYGVHKIADDALAEYSGLGPCWNVHGGLSPRYRGTITLFWPFFFLEPQWAGLTLHELTASLDAGAIVHQSVPPLQKGDGIHDVGTRAVLQVAEDVSRLLEEINKSQWPQSVPQRGPGKLFVNRDWRPEHLRVIYQLFDNDIVDHYLDGELGGDLPSLVSAFSERSDDESSRGSEPLH